MEIPYTKGSGCEHGHKLEQLQGIFSEGVGRLKHIDAKFPWVQQRLKAGAMAMEGVPTLPSQRGRHGNKEIDQSEASISDVPDGHGAVRRSERFVCGRWRIGIRWRASAENHGQEHEECEKGDAEHFGRQC